MNQALKAYFAFEAADALITSAQLYPLHKNSTFTCHVTESEEYDWSEFRVNVMTWNWHYFYLFHFFERYEEWLSLDNRIVQDKYLFHLKIWFYSHFEPAKSKNPKKRMVRVTPLAFIHKQNALNVNIRHTWFYNLTVISKIHSLNKLFPLIESLKKNLMAKIIENYFWA